MPNKPLGVMWKTVADDCNLACDYCYYSACGGRPGPKRNRIDSALLDKAIAGFMACSQGSVAFAWQGGEPLLAGLAFFEEVVALQARHAPPNTAIANALQTNGTLLDDNWAKFFKKYNFLIGVSLDGPKEIHDRHRRTAAGKGTFDLVMRKIRCLRSHDVDFNVLTVLHSGNVDRPGELMAFFAREGLRCVQFIPGMDFRAQSPEAPARYLISADQYGRFLCETFDVWYNNGAPSISVRLFDDLLGVCLGRDAGLCTHARSCAKTPVLEQNGDAFPCDFYLSGKYRLGNIGRESLPDLLQSPAYRRFLRFKQELPEQCTRCDFLRLCFGGCPRNRVWDGRSRTPGPDCFCDAYRRLFGYAEERLALLAQALRKRWLREYSDSGLPWPERNGRCICGSGAKFKRCCAPFRGEAITAGGYSPSVSPSGTGRNPA